MVKQEIGWAKSQLEHVTDCPQLEAEVLLSFVLGLSDRSGVYGVSKLTHVQIAYFRNLIMRRACFEPVAYILGRKEFYSLDFQVDARVLIPRFDTELLVDLVVEKIRSDNSITHTLDVGVGSGAILISILSQFLDRPWLAVGCDVSEDARQVARQNVRRLLSQQMDVRIIPADECDQYAPFDLVVINPPYVSFEEWVHTPPDVHIYEPVLAILQHRCIHDWLKPLSVLVKKGGQVFMEWGAISHGSLDRVDGFILKKQLQCQPKCNFLVWERC